MVDAGPRQAKSSRSTALESRMRGAVWWLIATHDPVREPHAEVVIRAGNWRTGYIGYLWASLIMLESIAVTASGSPLQTDLSWLVSVLLSRSALEILVGVVFLYLGAEVLVKGASRLALGMGVHAAVAGVTIVAFATTTPELFVSIMSTLDYSADLGLNAIIGSNIANIGLVLGVSALIRPLSIDPEVIRQHLPFMVGASVLLVVLGWDGWLTPTDGALLLVGLVAFTTLVYRQATTGEESAHAVADGGEVQSAELRDVGLLVAGLVLLLVGSRGLIDGGVETLKLFGVDSRIIGLTVLALGTSLPELAASAVGAYRGESEFSVGNVVGSNIYNVLAVLGLLAAMTGVMVPVSATGFEFPALLAFTAVAIAAMVRGSKVTRLDGVVLLAGYGLFVSMMV
jgi:cation:H+ antiporter